MSGCAATCRILQGLGGVILFAPVALTARKYLEPSTVAHGSMVFAQCIFGAGTILIGGDMAAHPIDPVVFALVREAMAGLVLGIAAWGLERTVPGKDDLRRILQCGVAVWGTNLLFIFGARWVSMAGAAAVGTLMQPCLPIVATLLSILLGYEKSTLEKLGGSAISLQFPSIFSSLLLDFAPS